MGNAGFWYFPDGSTTAVAIDLGEGISDLVEPTYSFDEATASTYGGLRFRSIRGFDSTVRILWERFTGEGIRRDLVAMLAHLENGGIVSFAADVDRALFGFSLYSPTTGQVAHLVQETSTVGATTSIALGDFVRFESTTSSYREELRVSSYTQADFASTLVTSDSIQLGIWPTLGLPVVVRERGYFPALRAPQASSNRLRGSLTSDHWITYTLDLELEVAHDVLDYLGRSLASLNTQSKNDWEADR